MSRKISLKNNLIISTITTFIVPYIFLYAIYIQLNGEISPGGGFQAGVIFASGFIAINLIYGRDYISRYLSTNALIFISSLGVLIYSSTGIISLIFNDNYLNYYSLASDKFIAQNMGIFIIELGIGLTVASTMYLIYSQFDNIHNNG